MPLEILALATALGAITLAVILACCVIGERRETRQLDADNRTLRAALAEAGKKPHTHHWAEITGRPEAIEATRKPTADPKPATLDTVMLVEQFKITRGVNEKPMQFMARADIELAQAKQRLLATLGQTDHIVEKIDTDGLNATGIATLTLGK